MLTKDYATPEELLELLPNDYRRIVASVIKQITADHKRHDTSFLDTSIEWMVGKAAEEQSEYHKADSHTAKAAEAVSTAVCWLLIAEMHMLEYTADDDDLLVPLAMPDSIKAEFCAAPSEVAAQLVRSARAEQGAEQATTEAYDDSESTTKPVSDSGQSPKQDREPDVVTPVELDHIVHEQEQATLAEQDDFPTIDLKEGIDKYKTEKGWYLKAPDLKWLCSTFLKWVQELPRSISKRMEGKRDRAYPSRHKTGIYVNDAEMDYIERLARQQDIAIREKEFTQ